MKSNNKMKFIFILLLIITQQLVYTFIFNSNTQAKIIQDDNIQLRNIGAPRYWYMDITKNNSNIYCMEHDYSIDIFDVENPDKINLKQSIKIPYTEGIYYTRKSYSFHDLENHILIIYRFEYVSEESCSFNIYTVDFNETDIINIDHIVCDFSLNYNLRYVQFYRKNNSLNVILECQDYDFNNETSYYKLFLVTMDITNITNPIFSEPILIHQENNFMIFGEYGLYSTVYDSFTMTDEYLCLSRIYWEGYVTDRSRDYEFSHGYLKLWNISNTSLPLLIDSIDINEGKLDYRRNSIQIIDNLIFYKLLDFGLVVYEISEINQIHKLAEYTTSNYPTYVILDNELIYYICESIVEILDFTDYNNIKKIAEYKPRIQGNGWFSKGILYNNILYVIRSSEFRGRCLYVFDCSNSNKLRRIHPSGIRIGFEVRYKLQGVLMMYSMIVGFVLVILILYQAVRFVYKRRKVKKENKIEMKSSI